MARRYKRLQCGDYVREALYNCPEPRDTPVVRRERSKFTSDAQKKVNLEHSKIKLEMFIGGNFGPGDLLVTPTFAPDHYPATYSEFQKKVQKFFGLLRTVRQRQGHETRYIYAPHHTEKIRWHCHALINAVSPGDWEEIKSLWTWGDVHIKRFGAEEFFNPEAITGYMIGETDDPKWSDRKNSARAWCHSTNLRKIVVTTYREHNQTARLVLPENCELCENKSRVNQFGSFEYVAYFRKNAVREESVPQSDSRELIDRGLL